MFAAKIADEVVNRILVERSVPQRDRQFVALPEITCVGSPIERVPGTELAFAGEPSVSFGLQTLRCRCEGAAGVRIQRQYAGDTEVAPSVGHQ